jgi:hypothetical protein
MVERSPLLLCRGYKVSALSKFVFLTADELPFLDENYLRVAELDAFEIILGSSSVEVPVAQLEVECGL